MKKVEIYILSGFLGSGKTTLLQRALQEEQSKGRKVAVIMNELGETSIDSNAVPGETPLKELLNGCVCCTIQGQLETQLHSMLQEYELDAIYLETTGVAHPVEVLDACMSPLFAEQITIKGIITTIDAARWRSRDSLSIQLQRLLHEQVHHADTILINKVDQLSEAEQAAILYEIQSINATAKTFLTQFSKVDLKFLQSGQNKRKGNHEQAHVHDHLHLKTYVHTFTSKIDVDQFEQWLREMPDTIYRIKGYLRFTHSDEVYMFQYSYGMPIYMKELMKLPSTLVFIGENLDHQKLQQELQQLEASSTQ